MDDERREIEKQVIEKRSSLRGWKERNKVKPRQKIYFIAAVTLAVIFSSLIIYQFLNQNDIISSPVISTNSSNSSNISSSIVNTPNITTPKITAPKTTPVVTPEITGNIIGKMGTPFILNGFEINVTRADSFVYTSIWIIVKNIGDVEKSFKISPSSVVIDNIGQQYERVLVKRAGISEKNLAGKALTEGAIFFDPLKEGRSPKKLILEINGKKAEIMLEK